MGSFKKECDWMYAMNTTQIKKLTEAKLKERVNKGIEIQRLNSAKLRTKKAALEIRKAVFGK